MVISDHAAASDQLVLEREGGCGRARRDTELPEDVLHAAGDGVLADHQLAGDLAVALPGGDEAQYLQLPAGKAVRVAARRGLGACQVGCGPELPEDRAGRLQLEPSRLPVAELEHAATKLAANAFSFAGQSCISVQRIYLEQPALDGFLERFLPKVEALAVGDPADEATDVGPAIDADARTRIAEWVEEVEAAGAQLRPAPPTPTRSARSCSPRPPSRRALSATKVRGLGCQRGGLAQGRLRARERNRLWLQAGIFTGSIATALAAARALEFGGVTVNEAPTFRADQMPYGGVRDRQHAEGPA